MNKLEVCKKTRKWAAQAFAVSLRELLKINKPFSEVNLRDAWLSELRKNSDIFPEGWYLPPPHGIGVLFAKENDFQRIRFKSLRHKDYWPRNNIYLDEKRGIILLYCSPVDKQSGIIGDFGLNIYFGKNKKIQNALKKHLNLIKDVFDYVKIDMKLSNIHYYSKSLLAKNGFSNEWWVSNTDPTGTNYGHTIPSTEIPWTKEESDIIKKRKNWQEILTVINKKRKFLNAYEETIIKPGIAFSFEPRVIVEKDFSIPTTYFHTIISINKNGKKELITDFDEIFKLAGMDYML